MKIKLTTEVKRILLALLAAALVFVVVFVISNHGTNKFNRYSVTDFELGERIEGIRTLEELEAYDKDGFKYFCDESGVGIENADSTARYYIGKHLGRFIVNAICTSVEGHSVMSVGVGDDELESKTLLLDNGFHIKGGGYNSCRALYRNVYVELRFSRGIVYEMSAKLK